MARRRYPSTTAYGGGPPPHRKSMGRILRSASPKADGRIYKNIAPRQEPSAPAIRATSASAPA